MSGSFGGAEMTTSPLDAEDIQGLVRFGFRTLTEAVFLLLKIRDPDAARAWLAAAPVTTAAELPKPPQAALQVAFTCEGLKTIGVAEDALNGFSPEFLSGMAGLESRSRRLGDLGANAPASWRWGGQGRVPHLVVMIYAQPGHLDDWMRTIQDETFSKAFDVQDSLQTSDLGGTEPFGFVDGVSQPSLDWKREWQPQGDKPEYGNLVSLGEFLLGYPNEYGKYTQRPLIAADGPGASVLAFAEDQPGIRDLGRNGTYMVLRQLQQDVRGFWRYLHLQAGSDPQGRRTLAESLVGRRINGAPLEPKTERPITGIDLSTAEQNQFTYDGDEDGLRCPFGAHIRRANPRNPDVPPSSGLLARLLRMLGFGNKWIHGDVMASTRFHRMLRRGREYGPRLAPDDAVANGPDAVEHGLHFICIVANISRQFEFVQNSWVMSTKFNALTGESDPLLGNRQPIGGCPLTNTFSMPQLGGVPRQLMQVPQFVAVRGGAYFFLPSLSALRYLASAGVSR